MHFHRDEKNKNIIYGYQNRHLELGYSDKEMMDLMLLNERDYHSWFDSSKRPFFITINKLSH